MSDNKKQILTVDTGTVKVPKVEIARRSREEPIYESANASLSEATFVQVGPSVNIEDDFHGWLLNQASALRNRNTIALDWDNLAEELEGMAAAERRELLKRLVTLFEHLLKLAYQPDEVFQHGRYWVITVIRTRQEIQDLLNDNPGLKGRLAELAEKAYPRAAKIVYQFVANLPEQNPWSIDQALNEELIPNDSLLPQPV
jgi:hypothetical protein